MATAEAVVKQLKSEVDAHPAASNARIAAAKARAARERVERLAAAQAARDEIERQRRERDERNGKPPKEPRASTTDPQARVLKMGDGGFRPAYNVQVASAAGQQIVVAVEVCNNGSDRGLIRPMLQRVRAATGRLPRRHLVDGGFCSGEDIEWAHDQAVEVYCPPIRSKHGTDPYLPRRGDGAGVSAWRERMASEAGKAHYKPRSICECIHARWRNWNLRQSTVRGIEKGPRRGAVPRADQQHPARPPPRHRLAGPTNPKAPNAAPPVRRRSTTAALISKAPPKPEASQDEV